MTYLIKPDTSTARRCVTWLIMCLLRICSALYCELSVGLSCQTVSSGVAGCSCLPDGPSPTPPPLRRHAIRLVRAASWHLLLQHCIHRNIGLCYVAHCIFPGDYNQRLLCSQSPAVFYVNGACPFCTSRYHTIKLGISAICMRQISCFFLSQWTAYCVTIAISLRPQRC